MVLFFLVVYGMSSGTHGGLSLHITPPPQGGASLHSPPQGTEGVGHPHQQCIERHAPPQIIEGVGHPQGRTDQCWVKWGVGASKKVLRGWTPPPTHHGLGVGHPTPNGAEAAAKRRYVQCVYLDPYPPMLRTPHLYKSEVLPCSLVYVVIHFFFCGKCL